MEEVREGLTADLVIVDVYVVEVRFVLKHLDELLGAFIVNIVVRQLELLK